MISEELYQRINNEPKIFRRDREDILGVWFSKNPKIYFSGNTHISLFQEPYHRMA